jgi:hypothetical protein
MKCAHLGIVPFALRRSEPEPQHYGIELGEPTTDKVPDGKLADDRANQICDTFERSTAGSRCREPKASRSGAHLEGLVAYRRAEMMHFVHDEQAESVADATRRS